VPQTILSCYLKQSRFAVVSDISIFHAESKKLFRLLLKTSVSAKKSLRKKSIFCIPPAISQDLIFKKTIFKLARNLALRSYYKTRFLLPFLFLFDRQFSQLSQPLPYFFNFKPYNLSYVHMTGGRFNRPTNRFSTLPVR